MSRYLSGPGEHLSVEMPAVTPPFAVSLWFNTEDPAGDHTLWYADDAPGGDQQWSLTYSGTAGGKLRLVTRSTSRTETAVGAGAGWNHVLAVHAGYEQHRLYLNGGHKATSTGLDSGGFRTFTVGSPSPAWPLHWTMVAEVALWRAALDDADAAALARGLWALRIRRAELVGYWPLGGAFGHHDRDCWKHGYHLTAYNDPKTTYHAPVCYGVPPLVGVPTWRPARPPHRVAAAAIAHPGATRGQVHG